MRGLTIKQFAFYILIFTSIAINSGRSPWRPRDPLLPKVGAHWSDDSTTYYMRDHCLEYHAIFCKFQKQEFDSRMLPSKPIAYRNHPDQTVDPEELSRLAENVIKEIEVQKKVYTDFTVLKKSDFNRRLGSGLIILKYKKYPFALKLFIKTPETFVKLSEGLIPQFFFRMGGGMNRHLAGFTRIPNLEKIQERINESPKWSKIIDTPRKWYWTPKNMRWITLEGKNIGNQGACSTTIPGTYGIIVDAIDGKRQLSIYKNKDCVFGLEFATYIGNRMDAHVDNLIEEKETGKIVIIDTEHFPTMVGLKEPLEFENYRSWFLKLSGKCFQDNYMRHKKYRKEMQTEPCPELYTLYTEPEKNNSSTHAHIKLAQTDSKPHRSKKHTA